MVVDKAVLTSPRPGRAGAEVPVRIDRPPTPKLEGAVVMVPGQSYHKNMPLMRRPAEALAMTGVTTVRFDWAYTRGGSKPSATLDDELADLSAVLTHVSGLGHKVVVVGKSLGCVVAARAAEHTDIAGLVWLTPALHASERPEQPNPGLERLWRVRAPLMIVAGDRDPLCHLDRLAAFSGQCPAATRVIVLPGDHALEAQTGSETEMTLATVVRWLGAWAETVLRR